MAEEKKWEGLQKKVESYLKRWNMIERGEHIVAGISGGADSVCLLFVLLRLRETMGITITAVHVNHMLRGEAAEEDERFVAALCAEQDVPCRVFRVDVAEEAERRKCSEEEAGREVRREAVREIMKEEHADRTAFAHHQDDNAETVIMNLCRGSRVKGMRGILPVSGRLIHPLLCVGKAEIEEALTERGIPWRVDETNLEDNYTRNRIRNRVMKELYAINPGTAEHISRMAEKMSELWEYLEEETEIYIRECTKEAEGGRIIEKSGLERIPGVFREEVIRSVLSQVCGREKDLRAVHVQEVRKLMEKQPGRQVFLPYGVRAFRVYEGVLVQKKERRHTPEKKAGPGFRMRIFDRRAGEKWPDTPYTKWFDYDIIKGRLIMRTRREGDYITVTADGKRQSLKKFLINQKVPAGIRDEVPLIADGSEIVWIVGYRQNKAYQITEKTVRIAEIEIYGGEKHGRDNSSIGSGGTGQSED